LLISAVGLSRHPDSGQVLAGFGLEIVDADGEPHPLRGWTTRGTTYDPERDLTRLLVVARVPDTVPTGWAQLWARFLDRGSALRAEEQVGVLVQPPF
jgi:hypothetical protein